MSRPNTRRKRYFSTSAPITMNGQCLAGDENALAMQAIDD
jgi:hypothetical protein